jgi:hypothetical protein
MDKRKLILICTLIIGLALIGIGVYSYVGPNDEKATNEPPPSPPPTPPAPSGLQAGEAKTPDGWKEVNRGLVPVNEKWTAVGSFKGRVLVIMWGKPTLSPKQGQMSPDGIDEITGPEYPLPGTRAFCSLAKINGQIVKVGSYKELYFSSDTLLYLGPNDEPGKSGMGFSDNSGSWSYKICVPAR